MLFTPHGYAEGMYPPGNHKAKGMTQSLCVLTITSYLESNIELALNDLAKDDRLQRIKLEEFMNQFIE